MKIDPYIRKPWSIPRNIGRLYNIENIENAINFFDRACEGNYYVVDYHKQKIFKKLGVKSWLGAICKAYESKIII